MKVLNLREMEVIEGGAPRGANGVIECIGLVYTGLGWFSVAAIAVSIVNPGFGLAVVGGCLPAMR